MILFWGLVIAGIIAFVYYLVRSRDTGRSTSEHARPEDVLAGRFARGEIDEDEYQNRRELLRKNQ